MDRGAARTVAVIDPQDAALFRLRGERTSEAASKDKIAAASARTLRMFPSLEIFGLIGPIVARGYP